MVASRQGETAFVLRQPAALPPHGVVTLAAIATQTCRHVVETGTRGARVCIRMTGLAAGRHAAEGAVTAGAMALIAGHHEVPTIQREACLTMRENTRAFGKRRTVVATLTEFAESTGMNIEVTRDATGLYLCTHPLWVTALTWHLPMTATQGQSRTLVIEDGLVPVGSHVAVRTVPVGL